ncbi:MAG: DNA polymerase IV [Candidatus Omnitrophota bacterium]
MSAKQRYIVHVDMDAFFASVEQRDNPACRGKPVIIGADPKDGKGRGVVSTCSYEARRFGIHSAMPISIAYKRCPDAVFLPPDMEKYSRVSHKIFEILERFTPEIEPISIDEGFLDITGSYHLFGTPSETCRRIKSLIKKETNLTASVGLAPNKMTAKIASDINKPDALVVVSKEDLLSFLHPLPVGKLWGVGEKTKIELKKMGIRTIGDLAKRNIADLEHVFGRNGRHAWELANGIDPRVVETSEEVKSISNEYTFEQDTSEKHKIKDTLMFLSEKVSRRLRKSGLKGKTVTLKIRFSDFRTYTRSITLEAPTNFVDVIYEYSSRKMESFDLDKKTVRLVGVRVSNLVDPSRKADLFEGESESAEKKERLHKALDRILDRFGEGALRHRSI